MKKSKALLVLPEAAPSPYNKSFSLDVLGVKRTDHVPLALLTVAAMFPPEYDLRVLDMNLDSLEDADLEWADHAFISGMVVHQESQRDVIKRCNRAGVTAIVGGPYATSCHEDIEGVDHFVLDEVEETFANFLRDLEHGEARPVYRALRKPDITQTPVPRFDLIDIKKYFVMGVQFSRGCPFDCEFCDITKLYGHVSRTKTPEQVIEEFDLLYKLGWRGQVFLVDDNFIGNKKEAMKLLPVVAEWQRARDYPFLLVTEASVNLGRMDDLMGAMVDAGFKSVYLGIESPNPKTLLKMNKPQNVYQRDENYLLTIVRRIQAKGMQVTGGFMLGADGDDETTFDAHIDFIQQSGIPYAQVVFLTALKNTDLYTRLERENRLLEESGGVFFNGASFNVNFKTEMDIDILTRGYQRVLATVYDPSLKNFFDRCLTLFEHLKFVPHLYKPLSEGGLNAATLMLRRNLPPRQAETFMEFFDKVSRDYPHMRLEALRLAGAGHAYEKATSPYSETQLQAVPA